MLNVAILGAGAIASTHADAFLQNGELCRITAVCNRHIEKAEALIQAKKLPAKAYQSLKAALKEQHIDLVSVCLAPALHCEEAIFAMEQHIHVLTEKPMANSLSECDRMIAAAKANQVLLGSICQQRYTTPVQRLKTLLKEQRFGKIQFLSLDSHWWRGVRYHDPAWRGTWKTEGGGVLTSQALHHLDLLLYLFGMPDAVAASMGNTGHDNTECEDVVSALLHYPAFSVPLSASLVSHDEYQSLRFQCEHASLSLPWKPAAKGAMPNGFPFADEAQLSEIEAAYEALPACALENHAGQVRQFLSAVLGKEPLEADGKEGRRILELITAIYHAAWSGQKTSLPLSKDNPLYTLEGKIKHLPHFHEKTVSLETTEALPITFSNMTNEM